jgi:hypothetical protein
MNKFKIGDRVRFKTLEARFAESHPRDAAQAGNAGTVTEYNKLPRVRMDDGYLLCGWREDKYELVTEAAPNAPEFDLLAAMTGKPLKFRSGCPVKFVAYVAYAKPHCQLVLLSANGNVFYRYANGKTSEEQTNDPGDILNA